MDGNDIGKCPVMHGKTIHTTNEVRGNRDWWPNQLNLKILNQNTPQTDPFGGEVDYAKSFEKLDVAALKADMAALMTDSQDWWPADYGHYGPFFVRMSWHSAGTYRTADGRGGGGTGQQRFAPLNSWPDNVNLDKARRLLWPLKQKYGNAVSWADLMVLAGNVGMETMGFKSFGFGFGRADTWEPEEDVYWGSEDVWLDDQRYSGDRELEDPLAAVQMGLIYVNPEGPNGNPDPVASGRDIRETFGRMGMNDEETVALVAGGHTFGKAHGAGPESDIGPDPEAAPMEQMGFGWNNGFGTGKGVHTTSSGIEGAWTPTPTQWDNSYFETLFGWEWELTKSPTGAQQWTAVGAEGTVPDAHDASRTHAPMMTTADMALRMDAIYEPISRDFYANPDKFHDAYARAWFKLLHRDMGPKVRYLGPDVPSETLLWQDPLPASNGALSDADVATLKAAVLASELSLAELVETAWASASSYRGSDHRGGANGARIALAPQKDWAANKPAQLSKVLSALGEIKAASGVAVSLADLIVIAGSAAVEQAAKNGGHTVNVAITTGRVDASQDETDVEGMGFLEPVADGFRNYLKKEFSVSAEKLLVDKAQLLTLTAPEMTALVGGMRTIAGEFTDKTDALSTDFFKAMLDMDVTWAPVEGSSNAFEGTVDGAVKLNAIGVDLVFGSNSQLRALSEAYAQDDTAAAFAQSFADAWTKVMNLDRFDIA